jgi:hypothetical protein
MEFRKEETLMTLSVSPRSSNYLGMKSIPIVIADTWLEPEELCYPRGGMSRKALAHCEDGTLAVVVCGIPDTYFSIPAYRKVNGLRVKGFVSSSEDGFKFTAYKLKPDTSHYIGGSGEYGCLYDSCGVYKSLQDAVDGLADTFNLGRTRKATLKRYNHLDLHPGRDGADYCEITVCNCPTPWIHDENSDEDDWK